MIKKSQRLNRLEVEALKKVATPHKGAGMVVLYRFSPQLKYGVTVSKKISTKAVVRNNLKRKLFSAVEGFQIPKPGHFLCIPQKNILNWSGDQITKAYQEHLKTICQKI